MTAATTRPAFGLLLALAATGCSHVSRTPVLAADAGAPLQVDLDPSGPWREVAGEPAPSGILAAVAPAQEGRSPSPPPQEPRPPRAVPEARGVGEVAAAGERPVKPLQDVARERFLDHPTEVEAESVTLNLPAALAGEVRLTGGALSEPAPGRRVAEGGAVLICRELTLRGQRVTLQLRTGDARGVQITARGDVSFVSRQRNRVLREEGLRSLILTNDQVTPLR